MTGQFEGVFIGFQEREDREGVYYVVRVLDEKGYVFQTVTRDECVISDLITMDKFSKISFSAEVENQVETEIMFLGVI